MEWQFYNFGLQELVPYFNIYFCVDAGKGYPDIAHSNGFAKGRALGPGGHSADHRTREIQLS